MAACVAGIAGAVEVSAMIQLDGSLAEFGKDDVKFLELNAWDPSGGSDFTYKMAVNGEKAGAEFGVWSNDDYYKSVKFKDTNIQVSDGETLTFEEYGMWHNGDWSKSGVYTITGDKSKAIGLVSSWNIWFKPIDQVKVTAGYFEYKSPSPQFGWWASAVCWDDYGFYSEITPINGLTINAGLGAAYGSTNTAGTWWFNKDYIGLRKLGDFMLGASYNIEGIGKIGGSVTRGAQVNPHGFAQTQQWSATPLAIDAYFANQPWAKTGYFADIALVFKEKEVKEGDKVKDYKLDGLDRLTGQFGFEYHLDALTVYVVDVIEIQLNDEDTLKAENYKRFKDGFELRGEYALGIIKPYVQVDGYSIMDKKFSVQPGLNFNVGSLNLDFAGKIEADLNDGAAMPMKLTLPLELTINL